MEPLLDYINDDGLLVEPKWNCPIIPMVLVNGMIGIVTGFSTTIPQFDPIECMNNIRRKLDGMPYLSMMPYYKGFKGRITKKMENSLCNSTEAINAAKMVCDRLGVHHYTLNHIESFKTHVVDDFVNEYMNGRTPNPCVKCNSYVKWENLIEQANKFGAYYRYTDTETGLKINTYLDSLIGLWRFNLCKTK